MAIANRDRPAGQNYQMSAGDNAMNPNAFTVFVCVTCRGKDAETERPGRTLFEAISTGLRERASAGVTVTPVECLSVCKRPCTVALAAPGKWTYVVGDLDQALHVDDVIEMTVRYAATADGIIPWRERAQSFRKGVVSRIPPLGFKVHATDAA
jgi:predicted metal-binding protein